jgi:putative transposase
MARLVDTESRTVEYPAVIMYEHNSKVLEYYAQPTKLDLKWHESGKRRPSRLQHTPDFLLVQEDGFWIEEWKEEARLQALSSDKPDRIFKDQEEWRSPVVEEHLRNLGISYRLRSANEHPRTFIQNLVFLSDYLDPSWPAVEESHLVAIQSQFKDQATLPLLHLLDRGRLAESGKVEGGGYSADDVYKALADGLLCFDLKAELLSDTHRARVYRDLPALELGRSFGEVNSYEVQSSERRDVSIEPGCLVDYDEVTYTIVRVGAMSATLQSQNSSFDREISALLDMHQRGLISVHPKEEASTPTLPVLDQLPPKRVDEILHRMRLLEMAKENPSSVVTVSKRTLQRYRAKVRSAGEHVVDQRLALASRIGERGNRERKIPQRLLELIAQVAQERYNTAANKNKTVAYRYFLDACEKEELPPCSMNSFNKELDLHKSVKARMGKRVAYQEEAIVWYL